jgi:hypothetical protein
MAEQNCSAPSPDSVFSGLWPGKSILILTKFCFLLDGTATGYEKNAMILALMSLRLMMNRLRWRPERFPAATATRNLNLSMRRPAANPPQPLTVLKRFPD